MIRRAPPPTDFFYRLDKNISEDRRLSWGARAMLIYLLGKPDHWELSVANLVNETADSGAPLGRAGVYSLIEQLVEAGYIEKHRHRNSNGTFSAFDYVIKEESSLGTVPIPYKDPIGFLKAHAKQATAAPPAQVKSVPVQSKPDLAWLYAASQTQASND